MVTASTLTPAGLLSGTPRRQQTPGAKGGLLRQVRNPGMLFLKDFTSILTMRPGAKAEILCALREIYDGHGRAISAPMAAATLEWKGKLGLIFGCTDVIDTHYSVEDALGNRFLLSRLEPKQGTIALGARAYRRQDRDHAARACRKRQPAVRRAAARSAGAVPESDEFNRLERVSNLVVRLRGAVERDRYRREIQSSMAPKAPPGSGWRWSGCWLASIPSGRAARLRSTSSNRSRSTAHADPAPGLRVPVSAARRRSAAGSVAMANHQRSGQKDRLPATTARRTLEDLFGYGLCEYSSRGKGQTSLWRGVLVL